MESRVFCFVWGENNGDMQLENNSLPPVNGANHRVGVSLPIETVFA